MNVLSLFDGIAGARSALQSLGINPTNYLASEIDTDCIKVADSQFPDILHLGDVKNIEGKSYWGFDLLIGGSPCQSLSICGKREGLVNESGLFYEFARLLDEVAPQYFLLENVGTMSKKNRDIISERLGVKPISINSSLLTAQVRNRYYWTNIPNIIQPPDNNLSVKDICEPNPPPDIFLPPNYDFVRYDSPTRSPSGLIQVGGVRRKGGDIKPFGQGNRVYDDAGKACTLNAQSGGVGAKTGLYLTNEGVRSLTPIEAERLQGFNDNYTAVLSKSKRLKVLGNSFTVPVIAHILSFI